MKSKAALAAASKSGAAAIKRALASPSSFVLGAQPILGEVAVAITSPMLGPSIWNPFVRHGPGVCCIVMAITFLACLTAHMSAPRATKGATKEGYSAAMLVGSAASAAC